MIVDVEFTVNGKTHPDVMRKAAETAKGYFGDHEHHLVHVKAYPSMRQSDGDILYWAADVVARPGPKPKGRQ